MLKLGNMELPRILSRKNKILLKELSKTDFKLRYQGSVLGYLWAILRPMMLFAILYVVFSKILRFGDGIPHYPVYLLCGTILWNFFTECTGMGIQAIVMRGDLIRKLSFPKWIIVISTTSTAVINLGINILVLIVFSFFNGVMPSWSWLLVPISVVELYTLALGIAFLLGSINVKYRDIGSIWEVLTQALFYCAPIIYPVSMVADRSILAARIVLLNPISQVIQDVRHNLITDTAITTWNYYGSWWSKLIPVVIVVVLAVVGALYFRKKSKYFAEEV